MYYYQIFNYYPKIRYDTYAPVNVHPEGAMGGDFDNLKLEVTIASEVLPCIHIVACKQALFCSQAIHIVGGGVLFPNNENKPK
jgi:hypothetical protein